MATELRHTRGLLSLRDGLVIADDGDEVQSLEPSSIAELVLALRDEGNRLAIRLTSGTLLTYQLGDSAASARSFVAALRAINERLSPITSERANIDVQFDGGMLSLVDTKLVVERTTGQRLAYFAADLLEVMTRRTTWNDEYGLVILPSLLKHDPAEWPPFAGATHVYCQDCRPVNDLRELVSGLKAANPALRMLGESVFRSP